jgi:hypothetical protein
MTNKGRYGKSRHSLTLKNENIKKIQIMPDGVSVNRQK